MTVASKLDLAPELAYRATVSRAHRREFGQFFTPAPLALLMAHWITANPACQTILDPAVGLGVFLRAIAACSPRPYTIQAYDLDPLMVNQTAELLVSTRDIDVTCADYLMTPWHQHYDGIICNPPYQKFQHYHQRMQRLQHIEHELGIRISGLANIYALFLLKAMRQLAPNGRAAFLLPSEFLQADYGVAIKQWLLDSGMLRAIMLCDPHYTVFDDALTTSCIVLLEHSHSLAPVSVCSITCDADVEHLTQLISNGTAFPQTERDPLQAQHKWRTTTAQQTYTNLVPLRTFGSVKRGIATGANQFFTFNEGTRIKLGISRNNVMPCITKAQHALQSVFAAADFEQLRAQNKPCWLFDAAANDDQAVQAYLEQGKQTQIHLRHLTRHRTPWYAVERREPAPILVNAFFRRHMRFVRNEAAVRTLTCFHSIYLDLDADDVDVLMAYLLTDLAQEIIGRNRREYGGGLYKFEPNDLNSALVVNLAMLSQHHRATITAFYAIYRLKCLRQQPTAGVLAELDQLFRGVVQP